MNTRPNPTATSESATGEAPRTCEPAPRLIRFFRGDAPFQARDEFILSDYDAWTLGRVDGPREGCAREAHIWTRDDALMSVEHAKLINTQDGWCVADAGSKNGTFLNGQLLRKPSLLDDGDIVECGTSFFIYREPPQEHQVARGGKINAVDLAPLDYQIAPLLVLAVSDLSLHLQGETGTGKEVVARAVHEISGRTGAFVARNCAAIPDNLFESELFGNVKGAFSGAVARQGQILAADGGTLFLDEIGELSPAMQAKLLRVLELKEVLPVGASVPMFVNFRLISATLCDLRAMVADGRFRGDLYGRLGQTFIVPPLRDHKESLGTLVQTLLATQLAKTAPKPRVRFKIAAARALVQHDWPFNVRELKQCIETALTAAMAERTDDRTCIIERRHLAHDVVAGASALRAAGARCSSPLAAKDRTSTDEAIISALRAAGGNRAGAAKLLGLTERTIFRRLEKLRKAGLDL